MYGYVTVCRDELKIKDFNRFRAYYCGLCKELGTQFGQLSRLSLTYDFAFAALLIDAMASDSTAAAPERCLKHLGRKRAVVSDCRALTYSAYMSVMLTYFKLRDDIADDRSLRAMLGILPYRMAAGKAKRKYPDKFRAFSQHLKALSEAEKAGCVCLDEAANHFAQLMAEIFDLGDDNLRWLGYNIGRFVYILDAYDDRERDRKHKRYNPILAQYADVDEAQCRVAVEQSLSMTLAETARRYEALNIRQNKAVLDNIIYLGLRSQMEKIINPTSQQEEFSNDEPV